MALWHIYLWPLCESCTVCTAYIFVTVKQSTYFSGYNKHDPLDLRPPHLVMTTNHPGPERAHRNPRATRARTTGPSNMSTSSPSASPHLVSWRGVIYLNYNNSVTQWSPFFVGRFNTHTVWKLTDRHERLRGRAVTWHANAVDGVHSHLILHAFNHPLGFIGCVWVGVKVQPHPPVAPRFLPLHDVSYGRDMENNSCRPALSNTDNRRRRIFFFLPMIGCPPSNAGGSHCTTQESSPMLRILGAWGGSGTSEMIV